MSQSDPVPASVEETLKTRLAHIQARVEAAKNGPWVTHSFVHNQDDDAPRELSIVAEDDQPGYIVIANEVEDDVDAEFIAHAREDVPFLLSALLASETQRQQDQEEIARLKTRLTEEVTRECF